MPRKITSRTSLENLRREAKRWLKAIRAGDRDAIDRFARAYPAAKDRANPVLRDLQHALARELGADDWKTLTARLTAGVGGQEPTRSHDELVADFLTWSCPDWRISGGERAHRIADAARLLQTHPAIANANVYTAVVAADVPTVRALLDANPALVNQPGGPREWPPLLYLCAARLPVQSGDRSVETASLLLDRGADATAYMHGGNVDIHYTALTLVLGRGEERAPMHARQRELTRLLLEHGADPHDNQVLYNVFADNTSRDLLDDGIVWLLELMHEFSLARGHAAAWADPEWPMFDMRGAPSLGDGHKRHPGAHFMLSGPVDRNLPGLARWMLERGAGPNTPPGNLWQKPNMTLYQDALARGHDGIAELLVSFGATRTPLPAGARDFATLCLSADADAITAHIRQHPEALNDHRALFEAVRRNRVDVVRLLLSLGVSPDVTDASNVRALHAASDRSLEAAQLLIDSGADVDARDRNYDSPPLGWAAYFSQPAMIELLGRYSRDIWYLVFTGRAERVAELLDGKPELAQTVSKGGNTPLMWLPGDADVALAIAKSFVAHGADTSRRGEQGLTAGEIAFRRGLPEVARLLDQER